MDAQLKSNVCDELHWDPLLIKADISVCVKSGVVILSGSVDNYLKKLAAEEAVKRVRNVKAIVEQITVQISHEFVKTDEQLAGAVLHTLQWNSAVSGAQIQIIIDNGWLTLGGMVHWHYQKKAAWNASKVITGLRGLTNEIRIMPEIQSPVMKETIRRALDRSADIHPEGIIVETNGSKVVLRGKARSWKEKSEIERVAWSAPGVTEVEDGLIVS